VIRVTLTTFAFVLLALTFLSASPVSETTADRKSISEILRNTTRPVYSVHQLPRSAVEQLRRLTGDDFRIAGPDQPFNLSDAWVDPKLPHRQLKFATCSKNYLVICYDLGGQAPSRCVVLLNVRNAHERPLLTARWTFKESHPTIEKLRLAYDHQQLLDYHPGLYEF
jgi:hypothetical protein